MATHPFACKLHPRGQALAQQRTEMAASHMAKLDGLAVTSPADFVRYDPESPGREIVGVNEFHVAVALLAGRIELLSQEIGSRHIFELCLAFGHESTAAALVKVGVKGCVLKGDHLGQGLPFWQLKGISKSVPVLFNGIEAVMILTLRYHIYYIPYTIYYMLYSIHWL